MSQNRMSKGFTLIELLIVLAIFASLLVVGLPGINNLANTSPPNEVAKRLMRSLSETKEEGSRLINGEAMICGSSDQSSCDNGWTTGWIIFIDANDDNAPQVAEIVWVEDVSTYDIAFNNTPETIIGFNGLGRSTPVGGNAVFEICGPDSNVDAKKTVMVYNSGSTSKLSASGTCP